MVRFELREDEEHNEKYSKINEPKVLFVKIYTN